MTLPGQKGTEMGCNEERITLRAELCMQRTGLTAPPWAERAGLPQ